MKINILIFYEVVEVIHVLQRVQITPYCAPYFAVHTLFFYFS
jgi:hypothetical protein